MGFNSEDISMMLYDVVPKLPADSVYLWDQASIHTSPVNRNHGVWTDRQQPVLFPAACPEFNPAEYANNSLKSKVRMYRPTTLAEYEMAVKKAFAEITMEECIGFYEMAISAAEDWILDYYEREDADERFAIRP